MNQKIENLLLGLMFLSWAILRVSTAEELDRWAVAQLVPAVIHFVVAILFLIREPSVLRGDTVVILVSLPSFVVGGIAINMAPAPHQWPVVAQLVFAVGAAGAVVGMIFLGRSFAIFPAVRTVVSRGPFRLIRHPIYFCELAMIAACCFAIGSPTQWVIFPIGVLALAIRIVWEEKVLLASSEYETFCQTVKYRLVPGVW